MLKKIVVVYRFTPWAPERPSWDAYFEGEERYPERPLLPGSLPVFQGWSGRTPQEAIGTLLMQSGEVEYELRLAEQLAAVGA